MAMQHYSADNCLPGQPAELFDDTTIDPYQSSQGARDPSMCRDCNAVYHDGRWQWKLLPVDAFEILCPACTRLQENTPAGYVSIEGRFAKEYRNELLLLIRNTERHAYSEHPLQRVIAISEQSGSMLVSTTDIHLARSIGNALQEAFKGDLDFHYDEVAYLLRVRWQRWT